MRRCSMCRNPGHDRRRHAGHIGFKTLARRIASSERKRHPSYSAARLAKIGRGAAAAVYRERLAKGRGR